MIPNWIGEDGCQNSERFFGGGENLFGGLKISSPAEVPRSFEIHNTYSNNIRICRRRSIDLIIVNQRGSFIFGLFGIAAQRSKSSPASLATTQTTRIYFDFNQITYHTHP